MNRMLARLVILSLALAGVLTVSAAKPQQTAIIDLLGTRLLNEGDFYGNQDWTKRSGLPRMDIGGRLQVHVKNTSAAPLTINGFTLGGKTFDQLSSQDAPQVADTKWWRMWPNPIPAGKTGTLSLRMVNLAADLPDGAELTLQTNQGDITLSPPAFAPQTSPLWMVSLNFTEDLNTTTIFVGNRGTTTLTLPENGGVSIDGTAIGAIIPTTTLAPGDVLPIVVLGTSTMLTQGEHAIFQVTADSGEIGSGGVRVFPYTFAVQSHMQGFNYDEEDKEAHYVEGWDNWVPEILDEPSGRGFTPMQVVEDVDSWLTDTSRHDQDRIHDAQTTVHNTSYMEGLVYDDIADIANSHWGNVRQDLATFLTAPKPNWYMPQNTWGQNEGLYRRESWYPLEDIQFQAFEAVGHGAKSIQWFLYQNHWRQGWGRREGTEFTRTMQDKNRTGHISNPLTWSRIGRTSGALSMLKPYLTDSAYHSSTRNDKGIEINTVVSNYKGSQKAIVVVMDHRTPRYGHAAGHIFRYDTPKWDQQVLYNQQIAVDLPAYVANTLTTAYVIDPWLGLQNIDLEISGKTASFTLPELQTGALVFLGTAVDKAFLEERWEKVSQDFQSYDDVKPSALIRARAQPQEPWRYPNASYRQRFTVQNTGSSNASVIALPIDMSEERTYTSNDTRVAEIDGSNVTEVAFLMEGTKTYETYDSPDTLSRIKTGCEGEREGGTSPEGCTMRLELSNGNLRAVSTYNDAGFVWGIGTIEGMPVIPWTTNEGYPDRWIPARFATFAIDANITPFPWWWWNRVNFYFDVDNDGTIDDFRGFQLYDDAAVKYDLGNGKMRFIFDMQELFNHEGLFPGETLRGQYRFGYLHYLQPNWTVPEVEYHWDIDQVQVSSRQVLVKPTIPLAPGESRTYEVYFDVAENSRATPSAKLDKSLSSATAATGVTITPQSLERAGVAVAITDRNVEITTQSSVNHLMVRHLSNIGTIVSAETLSSATATQSFATTLKRSLLPGEMLACTPIQPGGEGEVFVFNSNGNPITGDVPSAKIHPADWTTDLSTFATEESSIYPFTMDMSPDGRYVAVGMTRLLDDRSDTTGIVQVFDQTGQLLWKQEYTGRVFYVRFTPDSQAIYVSANLGEDVVDSSGDYVLNLYEDTHILKYTATGTEQWRHAVGSDTPAEHPGRTVFDMEVYPNGDLLYSEWNSYGVKLNGQTGQVIWAEETANGSTSYTPSVVPLADGGALLLGFYTKHINPDGSKRNHVFVNTEFPVSIDSSDDGSLWAFTGNVLRIMSNIPAGTDYRISGEGSNMEPLKSGRRVGRYPRVVRVSDDGQYIAAGSSDGVFSLYDPTGFHLWTKTEGASYVTDIHYLPDGSGVAFSREIFDYQHDNYQEANKRNGWRYRDVVEAYDWDGNALWRNEGPWRDDRLAEPFMSQFALSSDGTTLAVLTGNAVRHVNLTSATVDNSTLYPVEERMGSGSTPTEPKPPELAITGTTWGTLRDGYKFTAKMQVYTTTPITYTWQATEHISRTNDSVTEQEVAETFTWTVTGTKQITVTAENSLGSGVAYHTITIHDPIVALNHTSGQAGSYFTLTGSDFFANTIITINVNGETFQTLHADATGMFTVVMDSTGATPGTYKVEVVSDQVTPGVRKQVEFTVLESGEVHTDYPSGTTPFKLETEKVYLPIVQRK